jgi:DinB superfamily
VPRAELTPSEIVAILVDTPGGLSPREYIRRTDFPEWEFSAALDAFRAHREQILDVLRPLPKEAWLRTALVTDAPGKVVDHTLRFYGNWLASHEREHIDQIRDITATFSS